MTASAEKRNKRLRDCIRAVCALLQDFGVAPVLIGGCALKAHGMPIATFDVDLLLGCDLPRLREVMMQLRSAGYRLDAVTELVLHEEDVVAFRCFDGGIQIDLLAASTPRLRQIHARAGPGEWSGIRVRLARRDDVIAERMRPGRPRT